jgi:hypothetical protein
MAHPKRSKRDHANRACKIFGASGLAVLALTGAAWADFSYGAYFAFSLTNDYLVVAIDSRRQTDTDKGTVMTDDQCKIAPLGDQGVFVATGLTASTDARVEPFNVFALATAAYKRTAQPASLEKVATAWGDDLRSRLEALYPLYPKMFDQDYIGDVTFGYFLGFDADGALGGTLAEVSHRDAGKTFAADIGPIPKPATSMTGHREEVRELLQDISERAGIAVRQLMKESAGKSKAEREMIRMKLVVETVPGWAGDNTAGGDIAQVIFDAKTHQWRWYHRPTYCPER